MLPEPLSSALIAAAPRSAPAPRGTATTEDFADEVAEEPAERADAAGNDPAAPPASPGWGLANLQVPGPAGLALAQLPAPPEAGVPAIAPPLAAERNEAAALAASAAVAGATGFPAAAFPAPAGGTAPPPPAAPVADSVVLMPTTMPGQMPAPDPASLPAAMPTPAQTPVVAAADPEGPSPGMEMPSDAAGSRAPAAPQPQAGPPDAERPATFQILPGGAPVQAASAGTPPRDAGAVQPESEVAAGAAPPARSPRGRHPVTAEGAEPKRALAEAQAIVGDAGADRGGPCAGPEGAAVPAPERPVSPAPGMADPSRAGDLRPTPPQPLGTQLVDGIRQARDGSVELSLSPEELGRVRLTLHGSDASLHVSIQADRPETESLLRRHIGLLQQEFRDLGYGGISFDFGPRQDRPAPFADGAGGTAPLAETETVAAVAEAAPTPWAPVPVPGRGLDLRL